MTLKTDPVKIIGFGLTLFFLITGNTHAAVWALFVASAFSFEITWGR